MSQIGDLIKRVAPQGVPYLPIGEFAEVGSGATPASGHPEYWGGGTIPWMSSGEVNLGTVYETEKKITQAGYDSCSTKMFPPNVVVVALAGQGKTRGLVARTRIELCTNQSLAGIIPDASVSSDFLFFFLQTQYQQLRSISSGDGTRGGLNLQMIRAYRVPVPPLEVQSEIVRILDAFSELEAELEAELVARRRQYAFYRNQLLTFRGAGRRVPMGEVVANLDSQRRPVTRSDRRAGMFPYYGANGVQDFVEDYIFDGTFLLVGEDGSVVQKDGSPVINWATGKIWVNNHAHVLVEKSTDLRLRFLFHYLHTVNISSYVTGGAQPKLNQGNLNRIEIPVPPIEDQDRIISILDKFDVLVNDLSIGLPAELNARRQQYRYYRDKLLSFQEAV